MPQTDLERLVFSMEANVSKLVKEMDQADGKVKEVAKNIEKNLAHAEGNVIKLFGKTNIGEAVEKTFKRARFGVLEEGGAKIGVFGSALEALGPAGLAAAGGLAAAALAGEQIKKALEFAEDIEKTSKLLGVTTTQLQEFDFAASGSSVGVGKAREGLQEFNEVFGKYSAGLANGRSAKFLDALGFTPETARQVGSTMDALDKVMSRLAQIKNPQQRASLAHQLGLSEFLPVLAEGQKGVDEFTDAMRRAQSAGAIIAPDQIKRAAELNDKLEQVQHTAGVELKQAFIDLGPVIVGVSKLIEGMAKFVSDLVVGIEGIEHANRRQAADAQGQALDLRSLAYSTGLAGKIDDKTGVASGGLLSMTYNAHDQHYKAARDRVAAIDKEDADDAKSARSGQAINLAAPPKPKKPKATPTDQTADLDKTTGDEADEAAKELAAARAALTKNIQLHADFEKKAVDAETDKKLKDLADEEIKIRKSKNDAHKAQQLAAVATARADTQTAAAAKKDLIDREAQLAGDEAYEEHQAAVNATMSEIQSIMATMAKTVAARNAIEKENLRQNQLRELQAFDKITNDMQLNGIFDGPGGDDSRGQRLTERQLMVQRQGAQTAQQSYQQAGPVDQYVRAMNSSVDQAGQKLAVASLEQMNTALEAGLTNWRNFGQAAKSAIQSVLGDLIKLSLEKAELALAPSASGLFSAAASGVGGLFGGLWGGAHAAGGTLATGKVGLVGEKGPELAVGGAGGSQIIPANLTKGLLGSLGGMAAAGERGSQSVSISNSYVLSGAVSEQAVRGWIDQGRQVTLQQAASAFRANFGSEFSSFSALQG